MNMTFSILNRLLTFALIAKNIILYSESVLDEKKQVSKASCGPKICPDLAMTAQNSEISFELEILKRRISQQKVLVVCYRKCGTSRRPS